MKIIQGGLIKKERMDLSACAVCCGSALTRGVLHELVCPHCNGSGWVEAHTGYPLALEELVTQLSLKLQDAEHLIRELRLPRLAASQPDTRPANRFGAGGTTYTGD